MTLRIGVIGGSGLYVMGGLVGIQEEVLETPFGAPSGSYRIGRLEGVDGVEMVFLPRPAGITTMVRNAIHVSMFPLKSR